MTKYAYRILLRSPRKRRDPGGPGQWTSVSHIGAEYGLTVGGYLKTENDVVRLLLSCLHTSGIDKLIVSELELYPDRPGFELPAALGEPLHAPQDVTDGLVISAEQAEIWIRLNLRELLWSKLIGNGAFYIHFGYDYDVYVGSSCDCAEIISEGHRVGLFVDAYPSPIEQGN